MEKFQKFMSYVVVAALSTMLTLTITQEKPETPSKLEVLESLIEEKFIGESDTTAMEDAAAAAMVDSLGDRWSYYISAAEYSGYQDQMNNSYVGIGVTVQQTLGEPGLLVTKVNAGGPAEEAGMLPGDRVVAVDGIDIREMAVDDASALIKGEENTTVDITVERAGEEIILTVTRKLAEVALYDFVQISNPPLGMAVIAQVTGYKWDAIRERYIEITVGDPFDYQQIGAIPSYEISAGAVTFAKLSGDAIRQIKKEVSE